MLFKCSLKSTQNLLFILFHNLMYGNLKRGNNTCLAKKKSIVMIRLFNSFKPIQTQTPPRDHQSSYLFSHPIALPLKIHHNPFTGGDRFQRLLRRFSFPSKKKRINNGECWRARSRVMLYAQMTNLILT